MLSNFRRWFSSSPRAAASSEVEPWAQSQGLQYRKVREGGGFVIEGGEGRAPWRGEWGPSTRAYIAGQELRLIGELGVHRDVQVLVLNRSLVEALEKTVFDQYVEGVQTRIDTEVPPEARWLVMFPKLANAELRGLRERWVALGSVKPWLQRWLVGDLSTALEAVAARTGEEVPVVLTVARGRLTLRTALATPTGESLAGWLALFDVAAQEARRVMEELPPDPNASRGNALPPGWSGTTTTPGDIGPR